MWIITMVWQFGFKNFMVIMLSDEFWKKIGYFILMFFRWKCVLSVLLNILNDFMLWESKYLINLELLAFLFNILWKRVT